MKLLVAQKLNKEMADLIMKKVGGVFDVDFLARANEQERKSLLENADVIFAMNFRRDIRDEELGFIKKAKLIQITLAGAEIIPYGKLRPDITICSNGGAYSEPIAEHAIGMMLALARNFLPLHRQLSEGFFDQNTPHKMLKGATLGIVGFGGIGKLTAELARSFVMKIFAINSSGKTDEKVDFVGTLADLNYVLRESDFLLLTIALNNKTRKLIGEKELNLMKPDAVLVNVARGELIDEKSLYNHLKTHPQFKAGIEAWWIEPFNYPKFEVNYPFFELDNILGSPHNSYLIDGIHLKALDLALDNVLRFARGDPLKNIQHRENYI
ncbi:MAG: 2-hydroxyacid dehydrogenase [Bacteroidetes bacterium]|nr:2-hydroxyacid dehydrogenase [Bacteroidota bacterium]